MLLNFNGLADLYRLTRRIVKLLDAVLRAWDDIGWVRGSSGNRLRWWAQTAVEAYQQAIRLLPADPRPLISTLRLVSEPFTQELDASNRIQRAAGVPIRFIDDDWPSCDPKVGGDGGQT